MTNQVLKLTLIVGIVVLLVGCAASRAFVRGEKAARVGDWDAAVEYYRQAVQDDPDRAEYKIAYERATFAAAAQHADRGRRAEEEGRLEEALREYRRASELDSSNRQVASKMGEIERILRERIEAARPKPQIDRLREEARKAAPEPLLSPTSPLGPVRFENANARDVLNFIGESTGINVLFDREFTDRTVTINVEGVTLEEALQQIMITNQMFYKVLNERTIIVAQDSTVKRNQYRRSGGPHVLPVARGRDRNAAAAHHHHPHRRDGRAAAVRRQQDHQHPHRASVDVGDGDHRENARGERQAAG